MAISHLLVVDAQIPPKLERVESWMSPIEVIYTILYWLQRVEFICRVNGLDPLFTGTWCLWSRRIWAYFLIRNPTSGCLVFVDERLACSDGRIVITHTVFNHRYRCFSAWLYSICRRRDDHNLWGIISAHLDQLNTSLLGRAGTCSPRPCLDVLEHARTGSSWPCSDRLVLAYLVLLGPVCLYSAQTYSPQTLLGCARTCSSRPCSDLPVQVC